MAIYLTDRLSEDMMDQSICWIFRQENIAIHDIPTCITPRIFNPKIANYMSKIFGFGVRIECSNERIKLKNGDHLFVITPRYGEIPDPDNVDAFDDGRNFIISRYIIGDPCLETIPTIIKRDKSDGLGYETVRIVPYGFGNKYSLMGEYVIQASSDIDDTIDILINPRT